MGSSPENYGDGTSSGNGDGRKRCPHITLYTNIQPNGHDECVSFLINYSLDNQNNVLCC